tara:strand:+ start:555 stop:755 length:201 start_codon:yes stop_codon:yes gene_type:complete
MTIEYKHDEFTSVFFKPLENGKNEYEVEVHNLLNPEVFRDIINGIILNKLLKNPLYIVSKLKGEME